MERSARHTHTCTCKSNGGPQGEGEGRERLRKENRKSGQGDIKPRHATHTVQAPMVTHKRRSEGREKCQCVRRGALKDTRVHAYACGLPSRGRGMGRSSHVVVHTSITLHTADPPPPRPHRLVFFVFGRTINFRPFLRCALSLCVCGKAHVVSGPRVQRVGKRSGGEGEGGGRTRDEGHNNSVPIRKKKKRGRGRGECGEHTRPHTDTRTNTHPHPRAENSKEQRAIREQERR